MSREGNRASVLDLSAETKQTLEMCGCQPSDRKSYAAQCITARRLIENGVRFVEIYDPSTCRIFWNPAGELFGLRQDQ